MPLGIFWSAFYPRNKELSDITCDLDIVNHMLRTKDTRGQNTRNGIENTITSVTISGEDERGGGS